MSRRAIVLSVCLVAAACGGGEGGGGGVGGASGGASGGMDGGGAIGGSAATGGVLIGGNGGSGNVAGLGGTAGTSGGGTGGAAGAGTGGDGGTGNVGGTGATGGVGGSGGNGGSGGSCSPNCSGLSCGPDPVCGTSCGTCGAGSTCLSGSCCANANLCNGACCATGQVCNGGSCCTPNCNGKTCGDNGCGGSCGTCGAGTSCVGNSCCATANICNGSCCTSGQVCNGGSCCTPNCSGKTCGSNGCGGSCGTCGSGQTCNASGQCVTCTTPGATQCVNGDPFSVRTCTNGNWVTSSCPSYQACATNSCKSLCDGMLSSTLPRVCYFPVNESGSNGVYFYTNNTTKLPVSILDGYVGDGTSDAPIYSSGQTWPYAWTISQLDTAIAAFKLQNFTFQVQKVTLYFRVRRSGVISNITNVLVAASDGAIFATGTVSAPFSWGTNNIYVSGLLAQQFNYNTAWNFMDMAPTGDGFGNPPDLLDVNWYLLEVQQ